MLGLFSTLNLGARSLQAQQTAVEVAGQNLANVNNPAYTRQRVQIQTSPAINTGIGPQGTGAQATAIQQLRDTLIEAQMRSETSVGGYWTSLQRALQYTQAGLGEFIDRNADALSSSTPGTGALSSMADELNGLFSAFQSVATSPTSLTERQALLNSAQMLATRFNQSSQRLADISTGLDQSLQQDVDAANTLLTDIASLNDSIMGSEFNNSGAANDLRDQREQKLQELAKLVNFDSTENSDGGVEIGINGVNLVSGALVGNTLETFVSGGGQLLVRSNGVSGTFPLGLSGGSMAGTIDARDGTLKTLRDGLDLLAGSLITELNNLHRPGFSLTGSTGEDFFTGTNAANIGINQTLKDNPSLIQAAGVSGAAGDNTVALSIARLAGQAEAALGNHTFSGKYAQLVANLGHGLSSANNQLAEHDAVATMLQRQRDSVSGVSIDEEMSDLVRFQRAYQASAKIISTVDEMLQTVLSLKQ